MYRPKGYLKLATEVLNKYAEGDDVVDFDNLIEGIADAMLEALKAEGLPDCVMTTKEGCSSMVDLKGTLVFIPDEEKSND